MKALKILFIILAASFSFFSCDQREFDAPDFYVPKYTGKAANTSIDELKLWAKNKMAESAIPFVQIKDSVVLTGVVVANDVSGNIYKQIQIQDETGGLCILIDRNNIYGNYNVGQKVYINCKDLYIGYYAGNFQLGTLYQKTQDANLSTGQLLWETAKEKIIPDGTPNLKEVSFVRVRTIGDTIVVKDGLKFEELYLEEINDTYVGKLITLKDVFFREGGAAIFAEKASNGGVQTVSKRLISAGNESFTIEARNSSASNFSSKTLPSGIGSVTGVLSVYQTASAKTYQITFRDSLDCAASNFAQYKVGNGTSDDPWTVTYGLIHQDGRKGWIQGYIVGSVKAGVENVLSNSDINWEAPFGMDNTVLIAYAANETDYSKCLVVDLPADSLIRIQVNLKDNPDNWNSLLKVNGSLQNKIGTNGVVTKGAAGDFVLESNNPMVTIYNETFGDAASAAPWPAVADYAGYQKTGAGAGQVTYTSEGGTVSIRSNSPSSGYPNASKACNAMMAATGASLLVNDIATCGATTLTLSFGSNETNANLSVFYKINGTSQWELIPYAKETANWGLVDGLKISLPKGTNTIKLKFTGAATQYAVRVDDITITSKNIIGSPIIDPDDNITPPTPPTPPTPGTIFKETFGNAASAAPWPAVADYAGYQKTGAGAGQVTYTSEGGAVSVRGNSSSSGYTGASGACNAMMAAAGASLLVNNIATCGATALNLSFGSNETNANLSVFYKINGTTQWIQIPYAKETTTWGLVNDLKINLPAGTNTIKLKFTAAVTSFGTRVDDVTITTENAIGSPIVDPD